MVGLSSSQIRKVLFLFPLFLMMIVAWRAYAVTYTFATIEVPGAINTTPSGINNSGNIVGWYATQVPVEWCSFLYAEGIFTAIDYPGAQSTQAYGINDSGTIVGTYTDGNGSQHGFLYSGGAYTSIDYPGAIRTFAFRINNSGTIMGSYIDGPDSTYDSHGFLYVDGEFTSIDFPSSSGPSATTPNAINNSGTIVGTFEAFLHSHGFVYAEGSFREINVPNALNTVPTGVNDSGAIVGFYDIPGTSFGFMYVGGDFTPIDVPWGNDPTPIGINNSGAIIGSYFDSKGFLHGFLYARGSFTSIDFPDSTRTSLKGINDSGATVGTYYDSNCAFIHPLDCHGFLATPPLETISTPVTPSGAVSGIMGTSYSYSTGGSTSSLGNPVEYQFDWNGDGLDLSNWGAATQSNSWATAGVYNVRARAVSSANPFAMSGWSNPLTIGISLPKILVTPTAYDFKNVKMKRSKIASFKVKNIGTVNLSILSSTITGTDASMFKITSGNGSKTVKPRKTMTIKVAFKPISKGAKSSTLRITSNDPINPTVGISLSGTGQ